MRIKHWLLGLVIGLTAGVLTGAFYAYSDWRLNPGGIFRNDHGTDWGIVMETVTSWWVPVAGWVTFLSWVVLFLVLRRKKH